MKVNGGKPVREGPSSSPKYHDPGIRLARMLGAKMGPEGRVEADGFNGALRGLVKEAVHEALEERANGVRDRGPG